MNLIIPLATRCFSTKVVYHLQQKFPPSNKENRKNFGSRIHIKKKMKKKMVEEEEKHTWTIVRG